MEVFHASTVQIDTPDIYHSRQYLDFGPGFYVTTMYDQAEKYANRFIRRGKAAFINVYDMDIELSRWNPLTFHKYDEDWLDFVTECRAGHILGDYDIIIGGIADDKVFRTEPTLKSKVCFKWVQLIKMFSVQNYRKLLKPPNVLHHFSHNICSPVYYIKMM